MTPEQARAAREEAVIAARAAVGTLNLLEAALPASQRGSWELRWRSQREVEQDRVPELPLEPPRRSRAGVGREGPLAALFRKADEEKG